jgi:ATP-dependent helicase HepA
MGRVVGYVDTDDGSPIEYHIAIPNEERTQQLDETQFHVRSLLGAADPVGTLAALAHETPFFFERRAAWVTEYDRHANASRGLPGLYSASVELFPHQACAVRRVLQDPLVRYLLADEVGLGKTIESAAIMRQLEADSPELRSVVLVPAVLKNQWQGELKSRFHLERPLIVGHDEINQLTGKPIDLLVVDEAQRFIGADSGTASEQFDRLRSLCVSARYLLLLSATPILHHDAEVLALLHLLDPEQYRLGDLQGFRRRVARRVPIGRLLLALERASSPVILRRQLELIGKELEDDQDLKGMLADAPDQIGPDHRTAWRNLAARVRSLVAETWRLHRRLLRTRRNVLIEEGEIQRLRRVEKPQIAHTFTENVEAIPSLWELVDELRVAAAARATQLSEDAARHLRDGYIRLAQVAALTDSKLSELMQEMHRDPDWSFAAEILFGLERAAQDTSPKARYEALVAGISELPAADARWVVFCPDATEVDRVSSFLEEAFPSLRVLTLSEYDAPLAHQVLCEFDTSSDRSLLVVDRIAEEGLNLQVADGLIFIDLPFNPLQLEQRVGRLDRLDRTRSLRAVTIITIDDSDDVRLAFDRAWYEVVVKGLGLFEDSIADVPYLIERQMEEMARLAFERGPAALYEHVEALKEALAAERSEAEELAIIDGTSIAGIMESDWWKKLDDADAAEDELAQAFEGYVEQTLGLLLECPDPDNARLGSRRFLLRRDKRRDVLLPTDRLLPLASMTQATYTFSRLRATKEPSVELLRPGARLLDWFRELADWDDRGRAFVLWRRVPGWYDPRVIGRVCVNATLDDEMPTPQLDDVGRASLRRMTANWFVPWRSEWFLHIDCSEAEECEIDLCRPSYEKQSDVNLGGPRVPLLLSVVGAASWPTLCSSWAEAAIEYAQSSGELCDRLSLAQTEAQEWFAHREARLLVLEHQRIDKEIASERKLLTVLQNYVNTLLSRPRLTIDAIGVYVLSAEPPEA